MAFKLKRERKNGAAIIIYGIFVVFGRESESAAKCEYMIIAVSVPSVSTSMI